MSEELLDIAPKGFDVRRSSNGDLYIEYRTTGMGCMVIFLAVFVIFMGAGFIFAWHLEGSEGMRKIFFELPWWAYFALFAGFSAYIYFTFFLLWSLFGKTLYWAAPNRLSMEKRLFLWSKQVVVDRKDMKTLIQVKEGGGDDDSFPSWGLDLVTDKKVFLFSRKVKLLFRQRIEKSDWLGSLLAMTYDIPFEKCTERGR